MSEIETPEGVTYVVQVYRSASGAWEDLATVTVRPRTKRAVVIKAALVEAGLRAEMNGAALVCRALDVDSAEPVTVAPRSADPEWAVVT